jgi:hypothetical protein
VFVILKADKRKQSEKVMYYWFGTGGSFYAVRLLVTLI